MIPECSAGGYDRILPKSRSRVTSTRPSARNLAAMAESSAPEKPSSTTVSASKPPLRSKVAHSAGRFSSILSFKWCVPKEGQSSPRGRVPLRKPRTLECPIPGWRDNCAGSPRAILCRKIIQHNRHQYAGTADTRLAVSDRWVYADALLPLCHGSILYRQRPMLAPECHGELQA